MDIAEYLRFVFALAFVIALILMLAFVARRYGLGYRNMPRTAKRRLSISEILPVDGKRRIVIIKRDNKEHLLMIGGTTDLVIERDIKDNEDDMTFSEHLHQIDGTTPEDGDKTS